jgi:hypothetical protein
VGVCGGEREGKCGVWWSFHLAQLGTGIVCTVHGKITYHIQASRVALSVGVGAYDIVGCFGRRRRRRIKSGGRRFI